MRLLAKKDRNKDTIYKPEDEAAERKVGAAFADAWDLTYQQFGGMSRFDGLLVHARDGTQYIFELKNRNVRCDGTMVFPPNVKGGYPTVPLSKEKVESLHAEAVRRGVPALLVFHAKDGDTTWWVDIARCLNLKVHKNSGRTKTPQRPSDIEDCVYIPVCWFTQMETPYETGAGKHFGIPHARIFETHNKGEFA